MITALEELTGKRFDMDRLREVLKYSSEACKSYRAFLDLAAHRPSPISIFDTLIHMAIIVYLRGRPEAASYYKVLVDEIEQEKVSKGIGAVRDERFRLYWENLPSVQVETLQPFDGPGQHPTPFMQACVMISTFEPI
jgi:benzoyl-CoA reductase/2-hydroxyglutaryl-CoA dehydratase subunit BcrC/BadD/HgdB